MWSGVKITTRGALPLDVAELRARLRIDTTAEDALLGALLAAAAADIEGPDAAGVALLAQSWTRTFNGWSDEMALPGWPVTGVSAVRYVAPSGATETLDHSAHFRLALAPEPARLVRRPGASLPALAPGPGVVEVEYTLGASDPAELDAGLVTAVALLAGHYYENREAVSGQRMTELPLGVSHILARFRRGVVA